MTELLQTIKQAAVSAVEDKKPSEPHVGVVVGVSPLSIRIGDRLEVFGNRLVVVEGLTFSVGDRVLMLSFPGGQRFAVLGRTGGRS